MNAWLTPDSAPAATRCRRILIPDDPAWLALVSGALVELTKPENWEQFGTVTPEEAADRAQVMFLEYLDAECMIGTVQAYITQNPPSNCLACDGQIYQRQDYPLLYERINPALRVTQDLFQVPDLRDRFIYGAGVLAPLDTGGAADHTLTAAEMPTHNHTTQPHTHIDSGHSHWYNNSAGVTLLVVAPGEVPALAPNFLPAMTNPASASIQPEVVTVDSAGSGQAHNNLPPYVVLGYCVVAK